MAQYRVLSDAVEAAKQLEKEIVSYGRRSLAGNGFDYSAIDKGKWENYREKIYAAVKNAFPEMLYNRAPLNARHVSTCIFDGFTIENVLFNSLPGWEVNASVYVPKGKGPFPCVVCPTGHSAKYKENYYIPAQIFARNGYMAVSFDPPGCVGELANHNDHFVNGYIGWLTGIWSQTYFICDALACIDYMYSRKDTDTRKGIAITGVSGGGTTAIYASILDRRITFSAPVCCVTDNNIAQFTDLYTSCPETIGRGFHTAGINMSELVSLIAPTELLISCGQKDEVFDYRLTKEIFEKVRKVYDAYGIGMKAHLYTEAESGHCYSATMAYKTVSRMNAIYKNGEEPVMPEPEDLVAITKEQLACHPSNEVNMYTINRNEAVRLEGIRRKLNPYELSACIGSLLDIGKLDAHISYISEDEPSSVPTRWCHKFAPVILSHSGGLKIPVMHAYREDMAERPVLIWFGEKGVWGDFNKKGPLTKTIGFLDRTPILNEHCVITCDLSGLGELEMQHTTYDAASWNSIERILTYISVGNGLPVMAYRLRDALIAYEYAKRFSKDISVGGYGVGAITALLLGAYIQDEISSVYAVKPLASYGCLTEEPSYSWPESILIPDVLRFLDIPEILECLGSKTVCIDPLDGLMRSLSKERSESLYRQAVEKGASVISDDDWENALVREILKPVKGDRR
jgi:dienelactone hydrolase